MFVKFPLIPHIKCMWTYSKNAVLQGSVDKHKPERRREDVLAKAAELKLQRERDASQAMQDIEAQRQATRAKTARLRAERLALTAAEIAPKKVAKRAKK